MRYIYPAVVVWQVCQIDWRPGFSVIFGVSASDFSPGSPKECVNDAGRGFPKRRLDDAFLSDECSVQLYKWCGLPSFAAIGASVHEGIPDLVLFIGRRRKPSAVRQYDVVVADWTSSALVAGYQLHWSCPCFSFVFGGLHPCLPVVDLLADLEIEVNLAVGSVEKYWVPMWIISDLGNFLRHFPAFSITSGHPDADVVVLLVRSAKPSHQIFIWSDSDYGRGMPLRKLGVTVKDLAGADFHQTQRLAGDCDRLA